MVEEAKVTPIDKVPPALQQKRKEIREMMRIRASQAHCPFPPTLAASAADAVFFLTLSRCLVRVANDKPAFPDADTLKNDIARSAETLEMLLQVLQDEVWEEIKPVSVIQRLR